MTIAASLKTLFKKHMADYKVLYYKKTSSLFTVAKYLDVPTTKIIKSEILQDKDGYVLVVLPLYSRVNFIKLKKKLNRNFHIVPEIKTKGLFFDCDLGSIPPFGAPYKLPVIIDTAIYGLDVIYFVGGCQSSLIEMALNDFLYLNSTAKKFSFATIHDKEETNKFTSIHSNFEAFKAETSLFNQQASKEKQLLLPELPVIAKTILHYLEDPSDSFDNIASLIADDALINTQISEYIQSLFLQDRNSDVSASRSINSKILSFDTVTHVAFSRALSKAFNRYKDKVEIKNFWRHSIYCAVLSYELFNEIKAIHGKNFGNDNNNLTKDEVLFKQGENSFPEIEPSNVYIAGLLHNIGFLLLAELFYPEFKLLIKWHKANPKIPIEILEQKLLGMGAARDILRYGHAVLGANLLEYWGMPDFIVATAKFHHTSHYNGAYAQYVKIIRVANKLLAKEQIGDDIYDKSVGQFLLNLGLTTERALEILNTLLANDKNFNYVAEVLTN